MLNFMVTDDEGALIDAIEEVGFGEFIEVHHSGGKALKSRKISEKMGNLIKTWRFYRHLNKIVVHDGEPTAAEKMDTIKGFQVLRKFRF